MDMKQKILVAGGTGYIGSHTTVELQNAGFDVLIIDDLSNSNIEVLDGIEHITGIRPDFVQLDLKDKEGTRKVLEQHPGIKGVILFAASKAVGESVQKPLKYYRNNIVTLLNILELMPEFGIEGIVFSSSCTVYGQPDILPVTEDAPIKPAMSPYGNTQQINEAIIKDTIHAPALPFMFNMMFLMIPYGAVIAYSFILAQEKGLLSYLPYFYICLVVGMLVSKLSAQKMLDAGNHRILVYLSLVILVVTMVSYIALSTGIHLLIAGFFFGVGYGILQPLFQSFVTGTTPAPKRGVANATYMLSYDIGIGIGSLLMGCLQESIDLPKGFALTAIAYVIGGVVYATYVDRYYREQKTRYLQSVSQSR